MSKKEKFFSIPASFLRKTSPLDVSSERRSVVLENISLNEFKKLVLDFISHNREKLFKDVDELYEYHTFKFTQLVPPSEEVSLLITNGWQFDGYSCQFRFRYHKLSGFLFVDFDSFLFVAKLVDELFVEVSMPYGLRLTDDLDIVGEDIFYGAEKGPWPFVLEYPHEYVAYGKISYLLKDTEINPLTVLIKGGSVAEIAHAVKIKCILKEVLSNITI